jgi:hypothetical protein
LLHPRRRPEFQQLIKVTRLLAVAAFDAGCVGTPQTATSDSVRLIVGRIISSLRSVANIMEVAWLAVPTRPCPVLNNEDTGAATDPKAEAAIREPRY